DPTTVLIERIISDLKEKEKSYNLNDIIFAIRTDKRAEKKEKDLAENLFAAAKTWGIFSENGTEISKLLEPGKTTILDLSPYSSLGSYNVRALVISLVSRKLFEERMFYRKIEEVESVRHGLEYLQYRQQRELPLVWIMIDEAHEFLPREGKTAATDALIQLLREGRQPGISLVLATQQPGEIHRDVITQADIVISHRVTAKPDIEALNKMMQSYLLEDINAYLNQLPNLKGSAIILDDNSERIYPCRIRPKLTWHGGEAPTAVRIRRRI
ncbi:MAG: zonular occludens toxin domain-containing protein, partial [Nanoarchaeota archaeon]